MDKSSVGLKEKQSVRPIQRKATMDFTNDKCAKSSVDYLSNESCTSSMFPLASRSSVICVSGGGQVEEGNLEERVHFIEPHRSYRLNEKLQMLSAVHNVSSGSEDYSDEDDDDDDDDVSESRHLTEPSANRVRIQCSLLQSARNKSCNQNKPFQQTTQSKMVIINSTNHLNNDPMEHGSNNILTHVGQSTNSSSTSTWSSGPSSQLMASTSLVGVSSDSSVYLDSSSSAQSSQSTQSGQPLLLNEQYQHPVRIGSSCISVHSAVSQASNDSSLLDYPANTPICKFCHQRGKPNNPLISPCHCRGTIRYMHARCLMKWLDKLKRRNSRSQPLSCEICNYEYRWRKQFKAPIEWTLPPCMGNDRHWHTIFVICAILMVISMINLVIFGDDDHTHHHYHHSHHRYHLNHSTVNYSVTTTSNNSHQNRSVAKSNTVAKTESDDHQWLSLADPTEILNSMLHLDANTSSNGETQDPVFLLPSTGFSSINVSILSALFRNISSDLNHTKLTVSNKSSTSWTKNSKKLHLTEKDLISALFHHNHNNAGTTEFSSSSNTGFNPFHLTTDPWRRRKTYPTKPHEVILVISGCLFFISFFLGTFAQIKSEISFYNMITRFIHWNQQWIIEEYDPDGTASRKSNDCNSTGAQETQSVFVTENDKPVIVGM